MRSHAYILEVRTWTIFLGSTVKPTMPATPFSSWGCLRPLGSVLSLQAWPFAHALASPPQEALCLGLMVEWALAPHRVAMGRFCIKCIEPWC